jgi:protein-S-isoprenylcysteine O-methyltransferase Ste14
MAIVALSGKEAPHCPSNSHCLKLKGTVPGKEESNMTAKTVQTVAPVTPRQWIRLVAVYLFIPLVLLVCGGDLGWWQAWVYFLLIVAAGIGGRILAERRHPGLMAERQDIEKFQSTKAWDKVLAPLMALSLSFPLVIVAGLDHRFGWSPAFPPGLILTGFIVIALGYAFATWALVENRFFFSTVRIQTDSGHVVCDSGPYRIVRHPGYAGNIPPLLGIVLALGSVWTLIPAAVALIIMVIRTALEDQALQEELPGYRDYAQRVHYRLIPGVY